MDRHERYCIAGALCLLRRIAIRRRGDIFVTIKILDKAIVDRRLSGGLAVIRYQLFEPTEFAALSSREIPLDVRRAQQLVVEMFD